jgi:hypothetical protein
MSADQVTADFVTHSQAPLKVDGPAYAPVAHGGSGQGFGGSGASEPIRALVYYRHAGSRAANGGADVDIAGGVAGGDFETPVAGGGDGADLAQIADDAGEHGQMIRS